MRHANSPAGGRNYGKRLFIIFLGLLSKQQMRKYLCIFFQGAIVSILLLSLHTSFGRTPTDSLINLLDNETDDQVRLRLLIELTDLLNWEDLEKAKTYGFRAMHLGQKLGDDIGTGYAMIELSHNYDSFMNKDSALYYSHKAINLFEKVGHDPGAAQGHLRLGYIAENEGDFTTATTHLFEALAIFEKAEDDQGSFKAMLGLGKLFFKMDRYNEGIDIVKKARLEYKTIKEDDIAYYNLVLGNNYRGAGNFEQALKHYDACRILAEKNAYNIDLIYTHTFMADIYQEQQKFDIAREYYQKAIGYARVYKDRNLETFPLIGSGRLYNRQGQFEYAIEQFEKAMRTKFDRVHNYYFHEIYKELSIAYSGIGEHKKALEHLDQYATLRDSFFNDRSDRLRSEMQTKYETEKKEEAIQQKKRQLRLSLALLVLSAIGGILLWRANQAKRRMNRILEDRNEEKEFLIREIHHRVKNNLQVLASMLILQSDYVRDPRMVKIMSDGLNRVQTMGLVHQKLYKGDDLAAVNMQEYIQDLASYLLDAFGVGSRIKIETDANIPMLYVDTALTLGLIINELVTNSLKHAFPDARIGRIEVKLWIENECLYLRVADDGQGPSPSKSDDLAMSFGTDLIKILNKKLRGHMFQTTEQGFVTTIRFEKYETRGAVVEMLES